MSARAAVRTAMLAFLVPGVLMAQGDSFVIPPLADPVMDEANLLSHRTEQALNQALRDLQTERGTQLAVLTLPNLAGLTIEQASIRVADQWKLGTEERDNGVLFLIAREERKARIEVGQGLEGDLTDAHSKRILDEAVLPLFKAGDFDSGVLVGVHQIVGYTNPDFDLQSHLQDVRMPRAQSAGRVPVGNLFVLLFLIFLVWALSRGGPPRTRGRRGGIYWGSGGWGRSSGGGGFSGGGGGGFSGGGGGFSGGGASGGW